MSKARDLADFISTGVGTGILADGAIDTTEITGVTASAAEINRLSGVTSDVQTQINTLNTTVATKAPSADPTFTGTVTATAFAGDGSGLTGVDSLPTQTGYAGKFLTTDGTAPAWETLEAETEITSNRTYWPTDTSITDQIVGKYIKLQVVPANTTISGTWQVAPDAEIYITEVTSIDSYGEYLEGDQTISGNHIFYKNLEVLEGSTITVTGNLEGFGSSTGGGTLNEARVQELIDGSFVFETFGGS